MERWGSPMRRAKSMSKMAMWWLPGLSGKGKKETAMAWRAADIQTPSIGDFPTLLPCNR